MYTNKSVVEYYKNKRLYWSDLDKAWYSKFRWSKSLIESFYREARKVYLLEMTFDDFSKALVEDGEAERYRWNRRRRKSWVSDYYHREKRGYKKKAEHKKQELSEDTIKKREWREKVKDTRNQCKDWYKTKWHRKHGYRCERRYVNNELKKKDWEAYSKTFYTGIEDPDYDIYTSESWYLPNEWDNFTLRKRETFCNSWDWY